MNLLKIEWLKVRTYRTFWILFGGFILLFPITFYFFIDKYNQSVDNNAEGKMISSLLDNPSIFPKVWHSAAWFGGLFFILVGMLVILLVTNEVQYRTHRQNIIDGLSREEFMLSKMLVGLVLAVVATVVVTLSGLVVGLVFSKDAGHLFEGLQYIGYFFLMSIQYLMVALVIAFLIKRTGLAIIIYFAFVWIIDNLLWVSLIKNNSKVGYFLPLESTDSLVPNPFIPKMMAQRNVEDSSLLIAAAIYFVLMAVLIMRYFKKVDLKN